VYESSPEALGVVDVERWQAAQRRANRVLTGFHQACGLGPGVTGWHGG